MTRIHKSLMIYPQHNNPRQITCRHIISQKIIQRNNDGIITGKSSTDVVSMRCCNNKSTIIHIMVLRRTRDKPLPEPMWTKLCDGYIASPGQRELSHYNDVIISAMAPQITSHTIVYSTVYSGADQRKHQSSASLAFVQGIHRWPVNSPHKRPVRRKMFPFHDVIMSYSAPFICAQ